MKRLKLFAAALAVASMMASTSYLYAQSASEVKEEVDAYKDDVNSGIGTLSNRISDLEAAGKLKFKGDFRLRYEYETQSQDNSPTLKTAPNTSIVNYHRYRVRLRFGAEKQFGDDVFTAFRLVTGSQTDPTSTNQSLGSQDVYKSIQLDQAYLKYTPAFLGKRADVYGGKYANILDSTAITWDGDVTPEGLASVVRLPEGIVAKGQYMILNDNSSAVSNRAPRDQYLTNVQLSRDFRVVAQDLHLMVGYEFVPWVSSMLATPSIASVPASNSPYAGVDAKGMVANSQDHGLIPNIEMLEGMLVVKNKVANIPLKWTFHAARNTNSFNLNSATTGGKVKVGSLSNADAFFVKLDLGTAANKGDLNGALQWGYIEPNAVLSLYSDSDSGTGYNNQKWLKADIGYMLTDALQLNLGQYAAKRVNYDINGTTVSNSFEKTSRTPLFRTQLDFIVKI